MRYLTTHAAVRATRAAVAAIALTSLVASAACGKNDTQPSGVDISALQTIDTTVGTGATVAAGRTVTVHYTGWLYSTTAAGNKGSKFDSSVDRNQPYAFTFGVGQVIRGWDQGLVGMRVGGKRTLLIPSSLGYGSTGNQTIPPNQALVFDVELLNVQ